MCQTLYTEMLVADTLPAGQQEYEAYRLLLSLHVSTCQHALSSQAVVAVLHILQQGQPIPCISSSGPLHLGLEGTSGS